MMTREETVKLYNEQSRRLYTMSLRITGQPTESEEIMHDTLLKFISSAPGGLSPQQTSSWLARTCIRASIDFLRKNRRLEEIFLDVEKVPDIEDEGGDSVEKEMEIEMEAARVKKAISLLPPKYRMTLHLVAVEGMQYGEISRLTGIGESTLRS
ncbi:MAG: sigma-70 family RNA polymerase sigma factor, partial [Bacteroidales bacterium]|nr:sigma-70 family RNA polymerase sigma factor [Bacteroidales bacterium]